MFQGKISLSRPYLSHVAQIFIFGGEIFRELELWDSYFGDSYFRVSLWFRKPPSLQRDAFLHADILALPSPRLLLEYLSTSGPTRSTSGQEMIPQYS